jgi:hypothetical protein
MSVAVFTDIEHENISHMMYPGREFLNEQNHLSGLYESYLIIALCEEDARVLTDTLSYLHNPPQPSAISVELLALEDVVPDYLAPDGTDTICELAEVLSTEVENCGMTDERFEALRKLYVLLSEHFG